MWGETVKIEGHLVDRVEIYYYGTFLKYMTVILIKSPNNEGDRVPTRYHLSPKEAFSTETELQSMEMIGKGVQWKSSKQPSLLLRLRLLSKN